MTPPPWNGYNHAAWVILFFAGVQLASRPALRGARAPQHPANLRRRVGSLWSHPALPRGKVAAPQAPPSLWGSEPVIMGLPLRLRSPVKPIHQRQRCHCGSLQSSSGHKKTDL
eukprot:scaffold6158_cov120-Isochrysis_galbana.AAC.4